MLTLHIIALVGATLLVVRSAAFSPLRKFGPRLLSCGQCTGTWIGAAAGGSGIVPLGHGRALDAIIVGAAISFLALAADAMLVHLLGMPLDRDGDHP